MSFSLDQKKERKLALQRSLGWPAEAKRPLICLPTGLTKELGGTLFEEVLPGLLTQSVELLIVGKGTATYGTKVTELAKSERHRIAIVENAKPAFEQMVAAADMALFFCDPAECKELAECLRCGAVPIALRTKLLENYDPVQETGDSFLYDKPNAWHCFAALIRALETFVLPFDWRTIQKHGFETASAL